MAKSTDQAYSTSEHSSEISNLKLIENEDLDRTWKQTIRERQKIQEKKIWDDFCKNQDDILNAVLEEDPYQFIEIIPESCIEKILQSEHVVQHTVNYVAEIKEEANSTAGDGAVPSQDVNVEQHHNEEMETQYAGGDRCSESAISSPTSSIDSDKDDDLEQLTVETVIENPIAATQEIALQLSDRAERCPQTPRASCEMTERSQDMNRTIEEEVTSAASGVKEMPPTFRSTVTFESLMSKRITSNALQSTLYFDKIKAWRLKINEVLKCIIELFGRDVADDFDPIELKKSLRRANEFANRFTRIYVYQLQRQLNDLKRHMTVTLPFGKRTQFQAQATRVLSLHQNTLQALQMIHHPLEKSLVFGNGGQPLQSVLDFLMESTETCRLVAPSQEVKAKVLELYSDEIPISCIKLQEMIHFHVHTVQAIVDTADLDSPRSSKIRRQNDRNRKPAYKKLNLPYGQSQLPTKHNKASSRYATASKLSVYSLENVQSMSKRSSRERTLLNKGTDKPGSSVSQLNLITKPIANQSTNTRKNSARKLDRSIESEQNKLSKKPSLRGGKRNKLKKKAVEEDIVTMVETVNNSNCPTSRSETEKPKYSSPRTPRTPRVLVPAEERRSPPPQMERQAAAAEEAMTEGRGSAGTSVRGARGCAGRDVTALLHRLCGSGELEDEQLTRTTRVSGAANAQLMCMRRESPRSAAASPRPHRSPSTNPQLLKILEESIQKQTLHSFSHSKKIQTYDLKNVPEKYLLQFDTPQNMIDNSNQYRKKFIEYMMSSPMYLNNSFTKPWEVVARVSDKIVEDLIISCAREMQLEDVLTDLYNSEVN